MKISEHWLRELADPALSTAELADLLTFGGVEVEAIEPAAPPFDRVVVAEVLSVSKHPQADRLSVCQVNVGTAPLSIVCGAPNVRAGMRVPAALVGAKLPGLEIKLAKVRGVESQGMLCSAKELGLSDEAAGLLELPADAAIGLALRDLLDLDDQILTTKPTPNRGDCLSVLGMAREVAALGGTKLKWQTPAPVASTITDVMAIRLDAPADCPHYSARIIRGVNAAAATPQWMVRRLQRSGIRSISAVVDITNYVLLEMGQPLHAFDAAKLTGGIHVRRARADESLLLLNGTTLTLSSAYLVIADTKQALALAGIMGGETSGVTATTRDVVLESAFFSPEIIAGKTRMLGFGSDSAYRFERGVDFAGAHAAQERATRLILEICGGRAGPVAEAQGQLPARNKVQLRLARAARVLGFAIDAAQAVSILERLGCRPSLAGDVITALPPSHRFDIAIEEDLIEELARIHGYNKIPATLPAAHAALLPVTENRRGAAAVRRHLADLDFQEVVTYSFVEQGWEVDFCANPEPIALANPIASQMSVMRSSLIGGLVNALVFNASRKQQRVRLFEVGRCFLNQPGYPQPWRVGAIAFGEAEPQQWGREARIVDFFDIKADLEALLAPATPEFVPATHPALHPGKSATVMLDGKAVGWIGELHPRWQRKYDLPSAPVLFEVELGVAEQRTLPVYQEISKFPAVHRDLAAEFDEAVRYGDISSELKRSGPAILRDVTVFDLYRGQGVQKGKKSLAFSVLLQDTHKTLTDAEAENAMIELRRILQEKFNAKLR
ncbi:MAG: phenylalanine--tRNA ligase subunit beta [Burkholderiales bacterium]|jgi:phenylalanyl-tRNA synthetase beta chain|nr:phenylalanine--tRNA ligase subunit beta [Burkholderiales bacterium]